MDPMKLIMAPALSLVIAKHHKEVLCKRVDWVEHDFNKPWFMNVNQKIIILAGIPSKVNTERERERVSVQDSLCEL
jgi:hypothetical protein